MNNQKKLRKGNVKNSNSGITLIALVVTIIVLLILAGISIAMLSGNNGILQRAADAKTNTERQSVIEQARTDILGKIAENNGKDISKKQLATILNKQFEIVDENTIPDEISSTNDIQLKTSDGKNKINLSEIYVGTFTVKNEEKGLTIAELQEKASTYFGLDVINYAETLSSDLQDTKWQLFYAGALEGDSEERIYLILKEYLHYSILPKVDEAPYAAGEYKFLFASGGNDGIMASNSYLSGSDCITDTRLKKLNNKYFNLLETNGKKSTNNNMRAIAYMMDTDVWRPFSTSTEGYAEYAIGGPTVELLFKAYNKYKNTNYQTKVGEVIGNAGYEIRKTSDDNFSWCIQNAIEADITTGDNKVDSPYSVSSLTSQANAYYLASPSIHNQSMLLNVDSTGNISGVWQYGDTYDYGPQNPDRGFRPIILLDKDHTLAKIKDSNNNDAFKIVPKSE